MDDFDYQAPAELFHPLRLGRNAPLGFHRFDSSADAIKYACEQLSPVMLQGAILEVGDERFESAKIGELYRSERYPLQREAAAAVAVEVQGS